MPRATGLVQAWVRFWFTPADPVGLHAVRLLTGLLFIAWLLPFAGHQDALFGLKGWFDLGAYKEASHLPDGPPQPFSWSVLYLCGSDPTLLAIAYWAAIGIFALFSLGIWTRLTAVLSWVMVVSFTANPASPYDGDALLAILAFYLMIGYLLLDQRTLKQSLWARLLGPGETFLLGRARGRDSLYPATSLGANIALRLLQVHFAIVMVTSGLTKLQFGDWWTGAALWYPLYPPFRATLAQVQAQTPHAKLYMTALSLAAYAILAWQIVFPMFAWKPRWRPVLLGGVVLGWLGTAFIYELPLFGPAICIGCLSYLTATEWHAIIRLLARIPGLRALSAALPAATWEPPGPSNRMSTPAVLATSKSR